MLSYIDIIDLQSRLQLKGGEILFALSRDQVMSAYNGIGNESLPKAVRWTLTELNHVFELPAVIHDCHWTYYGNLTMTDFLNSNAEFEDNCIECAKFFYGWYNPLRYWYIGKAKTYHRMLNDFGWSAYMEAQQKKS